MPLSFIFFGTPHSCLPVLDGLAAVGHIPAAVVCQPDRPKGRGCVTCAPPTKSWAERQGIRILQPRACRDEGFLHQIELIRPDLGLVFAFGQLLPKQLLEIPRLGFINIHPSLLPLYRGAAPVQHALIRGDALTGVSVVRVTPRLDDGDVILQESIRIDPEEDAVGLQGRLVRMGAELVTKCFGLLESGQARAVPQDESRVVWAPALTKEDGWIDWRMPAKEIHNRIRGVQPWPGAGTRLNNKIMKIHRAAVEPSGSTDAEPGWVIEAKGDRLVVHTAEGALRIIELQMEGKRRMDAGSFLVGNKILFGQRLG